MDGGSDFDEQPVISRRKSSFEPLELTSAVSPESSESHGTGNQGTVIRRGAAGRISMVPSVTEDFMSGEPIRMTGWLEKRSKMVIKMLTLLYFIYIILTVLKY